MVTSAFNKVAAAKRFIAATTLALLASIGATVHSPDAKSQALPECDLPGACPANVNVTNTATGGLGGAGGSANATGGTSNANASANNNPSTRILVAPPVISNPSGPCGTGWGISVIAVGFGKTDQDKDCLAGQAANNTIGAGVALKDPAMIATGLTTYGTLYPVFDAALTTVTENMASCQGKPAAMSPVLLSRVDACKPKSATTKPTAKPAP